jgi:hypothetical protein
MSILMLLQCWQKATQTAFCQPNSLFICNHWLICTAGNYSILIQLLLLMLCRFHLTLVTTAVICCWMM